MSTLLETTLAQIQPLDPQLAAQAQQHLDRLTKPPGSLGRLEELARRYVAITGTVPPRIDHAQLLTVRFQDRIIGRPGPLPAAVSGRALVLDMTQKR